MAARQQVPLREFQAGPWAVRVAKSHILRSKCEEGLEQGCPRDAKNKCYVCRWNTKNATT